MASSVATPLERQFSTIAGIDSMTSTSALGSTQHHAAVRRSTATSTPPRRTCSRRSPRPSRQLPPDMPSAAVVPQGESGRLADPLPGAHLADAAALDSRRIRRDLTRAAHLDDQRRGAGAGVRLAEIRGARAARSERAGRARHRHRRSRAGDRAAPTSTCRPARSTARIEAFTVQANGQLTNAAAYRPLIVAYRNGAPVRLDELGRVHRQRGERQDRRLVQRHSARIVLAIQRQPGTNTVEVVERDQRSCCRPSATQLPAVGQPRRCSTTARQSIRESVDDVQFTLLPDRVPGRPGDLPLPAQHLGDHHPERSRCRCRSSARSR